jgi:S1-C subfamily serine protease
MIEIPQAIAPLSVDSGTSGSSATDEYRQNMGSPPPAQEPELFTPPVHSLQEFVAEGEDTSPLGLELREERRMVNTGEEANGLLVMKVVQGSPAEKAGLRPLRTGVGVVLEGLAIGAAIAFPPAILAVPIIEDSQLGQSYDMIIGVDGYRVTNFLEFEDKTRAVRPGDVVYLNILRDGVRKQLKVEIPPATTAAQY